MRVHRDIFFHAVNDCGHEIQAFPVTMSLECLVCVEH